MVTKLASPSSISMGKFTLNNGKYVLNKVLHHGIFSHTYLGTELKSGQGVMIQTTAQFLRDHGNFAHFQHHILKLAAKLRRCHHPHLAKIIDCFECEGQCYIVYQYIPGKSLEHLIDSGFLLRPDKAIDCIRKVGSALQVLHNSQVLHQDVKPANLIFNHDTEQIVLTNICLTSNLTLGIKQTQANLVSPEYSAPEQYHLEGKSSKATDVYGLAATLYYLLTGNHPLPAPLHRVIPVGDWCELPSNLSPEVRQAILLGLQSDLRKRPGTIEDWLTLLPREENDAPAKLASSQSKTHIYDGPNFAKKHQPHFSSTLSESKVTNSPLLPLECLPKKSQSPEQNDSGDNVGGRKEVAPPSISAKPKRKSFPLGALVITSLVASSAGVGFGLALRLNLGEAGSTLLHRKQSFPPLPDMPQLEEQ